MTNTAQITAAVLELKTKGYLSEETRYELSAQEYQLVLDLSKHKEHEQ